MEIILSNFQTLALLVARISILFNLIYYANFLIWLLPPLKQYKGGFFLFFLVLAISDPFSYVFYSYFNVDPHFFYAFISLLLLFTIKLYTNSLNSKAIVINSLIFLAISGLYLIFKDILFSHILMVYFNFIVFITLIIYQVNKLFNRNTLYTYITFLIFYEFTVLLKAILFLLNVKSSPLFISLLNVLEFLICIFFICYNLKNGPRFQPKQGRLSQLSV